MTGEPSAENSHWRMNVDAELSVETKVEAPNEGWLWDWKCRESSTCTMKPLRETMPLQALGLST